jgi:hypothetical protein
MLQPEVYAGNHLNSSLEGATDKRKLHLIHDFVCEVLCCVVFCYVMLCVRAVRMLLFTLNRILHVCV